MNISYDINPYKPGMASETASLVPRLEAGLSGMYTANTHPLSLVTFSVGSSLIGFRIRYIKQGNQITTDVQQTK